MSALSPIVPWLRAFYQRADWSPEAAQYAKSQELDLDALAAYAGLFAVVGVTLHGNGHFAFDGTTPAAIVECYDIDGYTVIDLCAWSISAPEQFATALGAASILGTANVNNPASWSFGSCLKIHSTPLEWVKAGCEGVCVLDHRYAGYELRPALGPLLARDAQHAAQLRKLLCNAPISPSQIIFPKNTSKRAA